MSLFVYWQWLLDSGTVSAQGRKTRKFHKVIEKRYSGIKSSFSSTRQVTLHHLAGSSTLLQHAAEYGKQKKMVTSQGPWKKEARRIKMLLKTETLSETAKSLG